MTKQAAGSGNPQTTTTTGAVAESPVVAAPADFNNTLAEALSSWTDQAPAPVTETASADGPGADVPSNQETPPSDGVEDGSLETGDGEVAAEAAAEPETQDSEPETEATETADPSWSPDKQAAFNKRVGKEVEKRKARERQLAELQATVAAAKPEAPRPETPDPSPQSPPPASYDPVNELPEVRAVRAEEQKFTQMVEGAKEALRQARRDPDAVVAKLTEMGLKPPADPDDLRDWLEDQRDAAAQQMQTQVARRETLVVRAQAHLQQQMAAADAEAAELYPWHNVKTDPKHLAAREIVLAQPWLMKRPDRLLLLGRMVEGHFAEMEKRKAKPAATPPKPTPKVPARGSRVPTPPTGPQVTSSANRERFLKTRDNKALEAELATL